MIYRNRDLFAKSIRDLIDTKVEKMHIDTRDAKPVRKRPYRQSPQMQRAIEKIIDEMLSANIIQPSDSSWSSPCLVIKKRGSNEYRFVNDLRAVTKPMFWPLPTMDDMSDLLSNKNRVSSHMKHVYLQVYWYDDSRLKTAFTANGRHHGLGGSPNLLYKP